MVNIYACNNRDSKYAMQKLTELKREIDNSTIMFGDFNTPISVKNRTTGRKFKNKREPLSNSINQINAS